MILSDSAILTAIEKGDIVISPFERSQLGSNSYDVRLGKHIKMYDESQMQWGHDPIGGRMVRYIDAKKDNPTVELEIPETGLILMPDMFYLGSTLEYTETHKHVPYIEGKSSTGRLSVDIHATAAKGDVNFRGFFTLELSCKVPVKVYAGMPIGQITYFVVEGEVLQDYASKTDAKYANQGAKPVGSQMFKNFK
jgi:dCTP deaminase